MNFMVFGRRSNWLARPFASSMFASKCQHHAPGLYEMDTTLRSYVIKLEFERVPLTVANFVLAEGTKDSIKAMVYRFMTD